MAGDYEQKDLEGALFRNEDKSKPSDPDYKGTCKVDDQEYWMNAWINEARSGKKYMKVKFNLKGFSSPVRNTDTGEIDDDIPF
jgi:uncharacterized protein (DUF736 family)